MITDFPERQFFNIGGAAAFKFAPYHLVVQPLPAAVFKLVTSPVVFSSGSFLNGFATLGTLKFTETAVTDTGGTFYQWLISGFVPGDSDVLVSLMEEMEDGVRHLVVVNDLAGLTRLVGCNAPLQFSAVFSPGDDANSARGYNFTFSGSGAKRAPVYRV